MQPERRHTEVRADGYSRFCLTAIALLLAAAVAALWSDRPAVLPQAGAAEVLPDPGAQRKEQTAVLREISTKLDKLLALLSSGNLKVQLAEPKAQGGIDAAPKPKPG